MRSRLLFLLLLVFLSPLVEGDISRPGGAGHALLFRDHGVLIENFRDLGADALTFEAWISTSDYCHASALFSYAIDSTSTDSHKRTADFNSFVIFDPKKLVGCRDFEYIDLYPDPSLQSCYAKFNTSNNGVPPSFVERNGMWHHVAVVWTAANNGLTKIYKDGLLMSQAETGKTTPLQPGGALMIGAEQDCYGGCLDRGQNFYGSMDEVRVWRTARTQEDILTYMRTSSGLERHPDLAAYWQFNDPEESGMMREASVAKDSSGRGNDLHLITLPKVSYTSEMAHALTFRNNYAMNQGFSGMPDGDISVEFWARTPEFSAEMGDWDHHAEFFSFASYSPTRGDLASLQLLPDAILIEKYQKEFSGTLDLDYKQFSTRGTISIHINANRQGNGQRNDHWLDFDTKWVDGTWHHIAMTWSKSTGHVHLYMDGEEKKAFWRSSGGTVQFRDPADGGVESTIAANTARGTNGSLVLGQLQSCYGGCFSPQYNLHGDMAALRIWNRVLTTEEVKRSMNSPGEPFTQEGLAFSYSFAAGVQNENEILPDPSSPQQQNTLYLGADAPLWVYSEAPLAMSSGLPVPRPMPGAAGHALALSDQQVLILKNFQNFPSDEITVEFWMLSTDACRQGVPFSYATGEYSKDDNTFLIANYQNWIIGVVEDEGTLADHTSGVSSTDGKWHHIAVTWRSSDGQATLYDNGRMAWQVTRGRGQHIPSGGTLVVGREQDCQGGCFDSAEGAVGQRQSVQDQEYGVQDFFGLIDEMRIWKRARTGDQIRSSMQASLWQRGGGSPASGDQKVDPSDPDLVAYWNFDEGTGYRVKDVTGHGHDLIITKRPHWSVVRALAVCGNGVVEGLEECDDGDSQNGDGCSSQCKIEPGWECTKTSPSVCWRSGQAPPVKPDSGGGGGGGGGGAGPAPAPAPQPSSKKHRHAFWGTFFLTTILLSAIAGVVYVSRDRLVELVPVVEQGVYRAKEHVQRWFGGNRRNYYDLTAEFDAADMEGPPEFTSYQGDTYQRLPNQ